MAVSERWAVIVAAGSGARLGAHIPKALVPLAGRPMFVYSLELFLGPAGFNGAVVVVPPGNREDFLNVAGGRHASGRVVFVQGGTRRSESVLQGLNAVPGKDDSIVLVHDAARPLADAHLVKRVVECVIERGNATPAIPASDTIKKGREGRFVRTMEREDLLAVQTPQGFRKGKLLDLLHRFPGPHPDDSVPLELAGESAFYVPGNRRNIKITFPEDLEIAEALLKSRDG